MFKKKMSTMKRKADETNKSMEETIAQQNTLIQTQNLTIQSQGSRIAKLERRIDRMTKKFLDCNAKVEDILRCGQTGIKLKRKEGADVGLLSGDESEASLNPSAKDGDDDDDDDEDDVAKRRLVAKESVSLHGVSHGSVVFPLSSSSFSASNLLGADSSSSSRCSTTPLPSSLIGVGNLTRSPIKLRLRQTGAADGDDDAGSPDGAPPSAATSTSSQRSVEEDEEKGDGDETKTSTRKQHLDDDADDEADNEPIRVKGGKSSSLKRKGKTTATAGSKRKKLEKPSVDGEACKNEGGPASTTSTSVSQRKRQKL